MTHKSLYTIADNIGIMTRKEVRLISKDEYAKLKPLCNKYERVWRNKNPVKHKENSRELLSAIRKAGFKTRNQQAKKPSKPKPTVENKQVVST